MTLVVKLGSSIVAADNGELRANVLDSVCAQVSALEQEGERVVMVTSGAVARGMSLKRMDLRPVAMDELQAASAIGQGDLFRAYEDRLKGNGTEAAQVLITAADIAARTNYLNARATLRKLIEWRVVPVINENDTTATDEITFGDNDFLAAQVAILLEARLLILLSNVDGLYSADPRIDPKAEPVLIDEVVDFSELVGLEIGMSSLFGSGGMRSKVAAAEMASEAGIPATICNGTRDGALRAAALGEQVGTRFVPRPTKASSFKLWIKYAKPSKGLLQVDSGAARMLREKGSSLLPVGILDVEGHFAAGEAVDVMEEHLIGKGISAYSSRELERIKGMKSAEVREVLPHAAEEVIHRDRFVLV